MDKKFRITPARLGLIEIFESTEKPLSVARIISSLSDKKINVNKTTVYRELDFLLDIGKITEVIISSGKKYYETSGSKHHHHLICRGCGIIKDVVLENDLGDEETKIEKHNSFKIQNHSLEFFGLCANCQ